MQGISENNDVMNDIDDRLDDGADISIDMNGEVSNNNKL